MCDKKKSKSKFGLPPPPIHLFITATTCNNHKILDYFQKKKLSHLEDKESQTNEDSIGPAQL